MRRAAKKDRNHDEIAEALTALGWFVYDTSNVGDGFFDVIAVREHWPTLWAEIKDGTLSPSRRKLTPDEVRVHGLFKAAGQWVEILESIADVQALERAA